MTVDTVMTIDADCSMHCRILWETRELVEKGPGTSWHLGKLSVCIEREISGIRLESAYMSL